MGRLSKNWMSYGYRYLHSLLLATKEIKTFSSDCQHTKCDYDFDCKWGETCKDGKCFLDKNISWKCSGAFNDPRFACDKIIEGGEITHNEMLYLFEKGVYYFCRISFKSNDNCWWMGQ